MKSRFFALVAALLLAFPVAHAVAQGDTPAWLESYQAARALYADAEFAEALPLAEAAYEGYVALYGENGVDYGYLANHLGSIYLLLDQPAEAVPLFEAAWKIFERDKKTPPAQLAVIVSNLAISHDRNFRIDSARPFFKKTVELLEGVETAKPSALADAYLRYGKSILTVDYQTAKAALDKAIVYAEQAFGKRHTNTAMALTLRARTDLVAGRFEEARRIYSKARKALVRSGRSISGAQRILLQDLALLEGLRGRYDRMIDHYSAAGVGIAQPIKFESNYQDEPACPKDGDGNYIQAWVVLQFGIREDGSVGNPEVIASHPPGLNEQQVLADARHWNFSKNMREMNAANRALQRMMIGCAERDNSNNYDTAWQGTRFEIPDRILPFMTAGGSSELASAVAAVGSLIGETRKIEANQLEDLETALIEAMELARADYGGNAPQLVNYYRNLGRLAIFQDRDNVAERYLKRARNIAGRQKGTPVEDLVGSYWDYATCVALVHRDGKLIRETERLIKILEQNQRPVQEIIKAKLTLASEFSGHSRQGIRQTMRRHLGDALALATQAGGDNAALKAKALVYLGESHLRGKDFAKARGYLEEIGAMSAEELDESAPIRRLAHQNLGIIAYAQGNKDEAKMHRSIAASGPTEGRDLYWEVILPVKRVPPKYPRKAERHGIQGWTAMEFVVDGDGKVVSSRPIASYPPLVFDKVTAQALKKWRYLPHQTESPVNSQRPQVMMTFMLR